ncbi:MAG TPA: CpcT/CpeT family chromophore lyase [Steroidobacteraceae bacterium]|nr:CpcT/CpeT family chromophore lyase [Steroidobacteraceae bacterium]
MMAFLAAGLAAVGAADGGDVAALQHLWTGVRDSSEQVVMSLERGAARWPLQSERRVRTVVAPVAAPWLGAHVLYLEEFLEDEPEVPRRQLLMLLEPARGQEHVVRVRLFTFVAPQRWTHLNYRPALLAQLAWKDLASSSGCELLLNRAGDQFHGGTLGRRCLDYSAGAARYLDYQLLISQDLYWYRRRVLRQSDGELQQEVIGFNRFEPSEARLYACRVAWSASGRRRDLQPLLTLDLYEAGGHAQFVTPDGRTLELILHGRDWPFAPDRDALLLLLKEQGSDAPFATAWAQMDAQRIALELGWLQVRCGAIAPDSDELAQ